MLPAVCSCGSTHFFLPLNILWICMCSRVTSPVDTFLMQRVRNYYSIWFFNWIIEITWSSVNYFLQFYYRFLSWCWLLECKLIQMCCLSAWPWSWPLTSALSRCAVAVCGCREPVPGAALGGRGSDGSGAEPLLRRHEQAETQCLRRHVHRPLR